MPRENGMPHNNEMPPLKKGNALVDTTIVDEQDAAHYHWPRSPLKKGSSLVDTAIVDEEDAANYHLPRSPTLIRLLLDEHAAHTRRVATRRRQRLLHERAARARRDAAAHRSLMATLDSLMAECCSDVAALLAEIDLADDRRYEAAANAAMSATMGSGETLPSARLRHPMAAQAAASAAADSADTVAAMVTNSHCYEAAVATAASTPSLRPFDAVMMAFKMLDGGNTHPFRCGPLPHPPRKRARDRRTRRRICRRHGPRAPNLLVSLLCGRRHRPRAPNYGGWA